MTLVIDRQHIWIDQHDAATLQAALGLVEVQILLPVMFTPARHSLEGYQCGNAIEVHVFFVLGRDLRVPTQSSHFNGDKTV